MNKGDWKSQAADFPLSRRAFLLKGSALAAGTCLPLSVAFPLPPAMQDIRIGYASITWGGNDRQAITDIAAVGFHGVQVRSNALTEFGTPAALRQELEKNRLTFVALSSGDVSVDAPDSEQVSRHVGNAQFVRDAGGSYLQIIDKRPRDRAIMADDYKRLGALLSEIGKRTKEMGVWVGYHNHMGSLGEHPEGVEQIMQATDPDYAKLELDIAHYAQGGGDPVKAVEQYRDRLLFLHIKDVESLSTPVNGRDYRWVELGRGRVDVPGVFGALRRIRFRGWAVIELDAVPDPPRTPKQCAEINKQYIEQKIGLQV